MMYRKKLFAVRRIMKAVYLLCLSLLTVLCSGQEKDTLNQQTTSQKDTIMATTKFDIKEFNKHQKDGGWSFTDEYGKEHYLRDVGEEYWEKISTENNPLVLNFGYYPSGTLKYKGLDYHGNGIPIGVWTEYDEKGNIVKQTDYDEPYKGFPWEKLKAYMESKDIDLMDPLTSVSRSDTPPFVWSISWDTKRLNDYGAQAIMNEKIDGNTGEVLLIYESCYTMDGIEGMPPCKKIIYDSKKPKKVYREYKGRKFYSEQEWKDFVDEDVKVWAKKNNVKLEDEPLNNHYKHQWFISERKENERKK